MSDIEVNFALDTISQLEARANGKRARRPDASEIRRFVNVACGPDYEIFRTFFDLLDGKVGLLLITYTADFINELKSGKDINLFKDALLLHRLEGFRYDPRENFRYLTDLKNFAFDQKIDLKNEFESTFLLDQSDASIKLREYILRD